MDSEVEEDRFNFDSIGELDPVEDIETSLISSDHLRELPIGKIVTKSSQQRTDLNLTEEFVESIRASGVIEPIVVSPNMEEDEYIVVAGHRRLAGAQKAGLKTVPSVIKRIQNDLEWEVVQFIENIQNEPLPLFDEIKFVGSILNGDHATLKKMSIPQFCEEFKISENWVKKRSALYSAPENLLNLAKITKDSRKLNELHTLFKKDKEAASLFIQMIEKGENVSRAEISRASNPNTQKSQVIEESSGSEPIWDSSDSDIGGVDEAIASGPSISDEPSEATLGQKSEGLSSGSNISHKDQSRVSKPNPKKLNSMIELKVSANGEEGVVLLPSGLGSDETKVTVSIGDEELVYAWSEITVLKSSMR